MFEKYNAVLRSKNGVPPLKKRFDELCRGNEYTTTIHALSSALVKLGKLTKAQTVYRGMKGARLPPEMLVADAKNIRGGVEFSFMSTTVRARAAVVPLTALRRRACAARRTFGGRPRSRRPYTPPAAQTNRDVAVQYAGTGVAVVMEMHMGMTSRGAEIDWLSMYPEEKEILFGPLTGLEVVNSRYHEGVVLVQVRLSVNLTSLTLEQVCTGLVRRPSVQRLRCEALSERPSHTRPR